ncbi:helix-turn-helix domain-containing protein [Daejeonella sp. H1SJ63]|uniref:XRE family transcriptional regulator n=1 Tax=Daejeonella sp. H1SJ63 TaxID=3034145 RepID=UPI0023EDF5C9|nr:helix-turn-helix domain-containing protein [Daejeonella sp. H1SJ63]
MQEILSKQKIGLRIRGLRIENALSQEFIAKTMGLSRSNYSQIELGNQFPSYEVLVKIAIFYNKTYDWIIHGEDFAIKTSKIDKLKMDKLISTDFQNALKGTDADKISLVKNSDYYDYVCSAKIQKYIDQLSTIEIPIGKRGKKDNQPLFRAFEVIDNGMSGVLQNEDIIICENITKVSDLKFNDIYVLITQEDIIIRRVVKCLEDNKILICKADNMSYPIRIIHLDKLQEIWHIRGIFSTKFTGIVEKIEHQLEKFEKSITDLKKEVQQIKKKRSKL